MRSDSFANQRRPIQLRSPCRRFHHANHFTNRGQPEWFPCVEPTSSVYSAFYHRSGPQPSRAASRSLTAYFTVNGTDAATFSHSTVSLPRFPPGCDRSIFSVSTGLAVFAIVIAVRPSSSLGTSVVVPSILIPHCPVFLFTISSHFPLSRKTYKL